MSSEPQEPSDFFLARLLGQLLIFSKPRLKSLWFKACECSCCLSGCSIQGAASMLCSCSQLDSCTVAFPALHLPCWQQGLASLSWAQRCFLPPFNSEELQGVKRKVGSYGRSKCWHPCCAQGPTLIHKLAPTHHSGHLNTASATDLSSQCCEWWGSCASRAPATWLCSNWINKALFHQPWPPGWFGSSQHILSCTWKKEWSLGDIYSPITVATKHFTRILNFFTLVDLS